jgi:hypothetical protein
MAQACVGRGSCPMTTAPPNCQLRSSNFFPGSLLLSIFRGVAQRDTAL